MPTYTPVSYNPFDDQPENTETQVTFTPVNYNPFEEPEDDGFKSNALASLGIGSNYLLASIGGTYGNITGDFDNWATQQAPRGREFYEQFKTDELVAKQRSLQEKVDAADGEWAKAGVAVWETVSDLDLLGNFALEQAPSLVAGGIGGKAAQLLGAGAKVSTGVGVGVGAALQSGDVSGGVYDDLLKLPQEIWDENAEYRDLAGELGSDGAKDFLATKAARKAGAASAVISAVTAGLLPNTLEKAITKGLPGDGFFSRALKGGLGEGFQELLEEGGGAISGNVAAQSIDPNRGTFEGVGQAAGLGLLGGAAIGGTVGALSPMDRAINNAENARNQVISEGGDSLDGAGAAAAVVADSELDDLRGRMNIAPPVLSPDLSEGASLPDADFDFEAPLEPSQFEPQLAPIPFEPNREMVPIVGEQGLPFDLTEEILFLDRSGQTERATRLRNAQSLYRRAETSEDEALTGRLIDRANEIVGTELSEEFLRQPTFPNPSDPIEGTVIPTDSDIELSSSYVEQGPIVSTQRRPRLVQGDAIYAGAPESSPDTIYSGSRGTGFATLKGAETALKSREKADPGFNWEIFQDGGTGNFRLAGTRKDRRQADPEAVNRYVEQIARDAGQENDATLSPAEPVDSASEALRFAYEAGDVTGLNQRLIEIESEIESMERQPRRRNATSPDEADVLTAVVNLGGLNTEEAIAQGIDPESIKGRLNSSGSFTRYVGNNRPFKSNGISFDAMGELLTEQGWFAERPDANTVVDLVIEAVNSQNPVFAGAGGSQLETLRSEESYVARAISEIESDPSIGGALTDDEISSLDKIYEEAFNAIYGQAQNTQERSPEGNASAIDAAADRGPLQSPTQGSPGGERAGTTQAPGDIGRDPNSGPQQEITQAAPQGAVSTSGAPEFELQSYSEEEIAALEGRDIQVLDAREQIDRERQGFDLTPSQGSVQSDPLDRPQTEGFDFTSTAPSSLPIKDETASIEAETEAEQPSSAPEQRNLNSGVSKQELVQIADQFQQAMAADFEDGNSVSRVFKAPEKDEIVRTQAKVNKYVESNGFLSKQEAGSIVEGWKENARRQGENEETRSANSNKVVLSLFDLTGSWAKPWIEAGYDVYTFDIQDDAIFGDVNNFNTQFFADTFNSFEGKDVHAILAACPCTDFASSGARWFAAKDEDGRTLASVDLVHQTLRTIEYFKPNLWAVENPVGRIEKMGGLPPWRLSFDPFHFGEDYTKKTLLWGRFNADLPIAPTEPTMGSKMHSQYGGKSIATKNARSETPEGFAYAFFDANNAVDNPILGVGNKYDMIDARSIQGAIERGLTEEEIGRVVGDKYYQEQDYEGAQADLDQADSGDLPLFSRGDAAAGRGSARRGATRNAILTDDKFNSVIDRVIGPDRDNGSVVLVDRFDGLPEEIQQSAGDQGSDGNDVTAVFHRGTVYVVKSKMRSEGQLERALLHEGTHGGVAAMFKDQSLIKSLDRMWASIGGQKGFDKLAKQFGIQEKLRPYESGMEGGRYDQETRNAVLVNEMLAYVGEQGSKTMKLRALEVLGAIREWFRRNGFLRLSKLRASDIAKVARDAREGYLRSRGNMAADIPSFAMDPTARDRAMKTDLSLYSNAEQTLIDEGEKIFKPSKKNPDASVRGDQILSFLKGRGLKKEEAGYTELESYLLSGDKPRFTRDEVIKFLRSERPFLEEITSSMTPDQRDSQDASGLEWAEETATGQEYYDYLYEDYVDDLSRDDFDNISDTLFQVLKKNVDKAYESTLKAITEAQANDEFDFDLSKLSAVKGTDLMTDTEARMAYIREELGNDFVYIAMKEGLETEIDLALSDKAESQYMENPYVNYDLQTETDADWVQIFGNDDIGYTLNIKLGEIKNTENDMYDIDEAKDRARDWLLEYGALDGTRPDVKFFDSLSDVSEETNWTRYREIKMTTDGKFGDFSEGHFDEDNVLYNVLATDRDTDLGKTFVIEEMQSDWHSKIRKAGGARNDAAARTAIAKANAQEKAVAAELEKIREASVKVSDEMSNRIYDALGVENDVEEVKEKTSKIVSVLNFDDVLTEKGREKLASGGSELRTMSASDVQEYFDLDALQSKYPRMTEALEEPTLDGNLLARRTKILEGSYYYAELMPIINSPGFMALAQEKRALEEKRDEQREKLALAKDAEIALGRLPPDSPFRDDRYVELGVKRSIITAIEEGKDAFAWSMADRVQARWSENFDYEAQYNRKMRKAAEKITGEKAVGLGSNGNASEVDGDTDQFWAVPLSDELKARITEEGLPMFQRMDDNSSNSQTPPGESERIYPKRPIEETLADKFLRTLQDKMLPLKRTQQSIVEGDGRQLSTEEDTYLTEELFYGKTEEDLRQLRVRLIEPFVQALKDTGITVDELDEYLIARHARERNSQIAMINEGMPDGGSGMTNAEAEAMKAKVLASGRQADFDRLAYSVDQMTALTRDLVVSGGLGTDEQRSSYEAMYEYYVPLRGFADDEVDSNGNKIRTGKGFDIRGRESRRALGRSSKAKSPTAQVIADLTEKTIRNRKNEVGQTFLTFVENHPDPASWEVFTDENPDLERRLVGSLVREGQPVNMSGSDQYFAVKRDGVQHYIKIHDVRLLRAMQNLGPEKLGAVTKIVRPFTRYLSMINTSLSPEFVVTNFTRDIETAVIAVLAEQSREGGKIEGKAIAAKVVKGTPKAIATIRSASKNEAVNDAADPEASEYRKFYQEFLDDGAKTGYFDTPEVDEIAASLEKELRRAEPGAVNTTVNALKSVGKFIESWNTAVENGVRLSSYIESRKSGVPRERAASLAKNLTVNFNRKGEMGSAINSWYMFFNAAVQGVAQFARTLSPIDVNSRGKPELRKEFNLAQKVAAGIAASSVGFAMLMREMGGEDDDGEAYWDKIPSSTRERNLVIMKPGTGGDYYKIPLPYGYNFFWNIGDSLEGALAGSAKRQDKLLGDLASAFITSFSPISLRRADSGAESALLTGTPSPFLPVAEVAVNTNFFGESIYPENFPGGAQKADAALYYPSTKEGYVAVAKWLNEATGGSDYRSGIADFSPEVLQQVIEYAGGGALRFVTGSTDTITRTARGRAVEPSNIPFARMIAGKDRSDYADMDTFYKRRQEILNARKEYDVATSQEDRVASDEGFNRIRLLYPRANSTYKSLRRFRDQELRLKARDDLTPRELDDQLEELRTRKDDLVDRFNLAFDEFTQGD